MFDARLGEDVFLPIAADKDAFCFRLAMHGMSRILPDAIREHPEVISAGQEYSNKSRLMRVSTGESMNKDMDIAVAAIFAYAHGIDSISYLYYGGTDEIDLSESCSFKCVSPEIAEHAHEAWHEACESAGVLEDDLFWQQNGDSGAGDGHVYSCDLTVDLHSMESHQGVEEYDESEDDDNDWNDNLQYSDESDDYEPPDDGGL